MLPQLQRARGVLEQPAEVQAGGTDAPLQARLRERQGGQMARAAKRDAAPASGRGGARARDLNAAPSADHGAPVVGLAGWSSAAGLEAKSLKPKSYGRVEWASHALETAEE